MKFFILSRGRHERYPGTHGYRGTGRYPSKFRKFGYRWVPGTGQKKILGTDGYRVPGKFSLMPTPDSESNGGILDSLFGLSIRW